MSRRVRFISALITSLVTAGTAPASTLPSDQVASLRSTLADMHDTVRDRYYALDKLGPGFEAAFASAREAMARVSNLDEGCALIADACAQVDPRIRFYPPPRSARADYGWRWRLIGDAAYVTQLDRIGDAVQQGLKLGDRILSIEGLPLDRQSYQQLHYLFNTLSPRTVLRVEAQSPGEPARLLAIATTVRPQRRTRTVNSGGGAGVEWVFTGKEKQHVEASRHVQTHLRRIGPVAVWKCEEIHGAIFDIAEGLGAIGDAEALVIDLRGQYGVRWEPALRLLEGIFADGFDLGSLQRAGPDASLRVSGGSHAFKGLVLVLQDSRTAGFAELFAHVVQQRQRGMVIGDRTMGRVFEQAGFRRGTGTHSSFTVASVVLPSGDLKLADGAVLDGRGVAPDLLLLPQPADLAGQRDIVLARALTMARQTITPEEAGKLFWIDYDDDEDSEN